MVISKALEGFVLELSSQDYSPHTVRMHKLFIERLMKFGGDVEVSSVTADDLKRYLIYMRNDFIPVRPGKAPREGPLGQASIDNLVKALRAFFGWLHRSGFTAARPDLEIKFPRYESPEVQPFTEGELKAILKACVQAGQRKRRTALRDTFIVILLIDTGIRLGELERLRVKDINLQLGEIYVRPFRTSIKSRPRIIPIGASCKRAAWRYLQTRELRPDDMLFVTATGAGVTGSQIQNLIYDIGKCAGVPHVHPHRFRHTFAIEFLRNGGDVFSLQKLMGHTTLEQTRKYVAWAQADVETAHRKASPADRWRL